MREMGFEAFIKKASGSSAVADADADFRSEDDERIFCITEQRSGQPSVIRYDHFSGRVCRTWHTNKLRVFPINREDAASRKYLNSQFELPHTGNFTSDRLHALVQIRC